MTVNPPEPPLPAPAASAVVPPSPYATAPATATAAPIYPVVPVAPDPRRDKNPFGITALVFMIASFLVPVGFLVAPIVAGVAGGLELGWAILGGLVFLVIGLVPAAGLALVAVALAVVSLVRSNRKVAGIVVLIFTTPLVLTGLAMLPAFINGQF